MKNFTLINYFKNLLFFILFFHINGLGEINDTAPIPEYSYMGTEVAINGISTDKVYLLIKDTNDNIYATKEILKEWNFIPPSGEKIVYDSLIYYKISNYDNLKYELDQNSMKLNIFAQATIFNKNYLENKENYIEYKKIKESGFFINHDVLLSLGENKILSFSGDANFFTTYGTFSSGFLLKNENTNHEIKRLLTSWSVDSPKNMTTTTFGDNFSVVAPWTGSSLIGGIHWTRNFSSQPDLNRYPGIILHGNSVLPSTIDLFINNAQTWKTSVNEGPFAIDNIPVVLGNGKAKIVQRDLLGRQTVYEIPYYIIPNLLKPGLSDFSVSLGFLRKNLGADNFNYPNPIGSILYRLGINGQFTLDACGEFLLQSQAIGIGGSLVLNDWFSVSPYLAISNSVRGQGSLLQMSINRQGTFYNLGGSLAFRTKDFSSVQYLNSEKGPPALESTLFTGISLDYMGSLSFSLTHRSFREQIENPIIMTIGYQLSPWNLFSLNLSGVINLTSSIGNGLFLSLSSGSPGNKGAFIASNTIGENISQTYSYLKSAPVGEGYGIGFKVQNKTQTTVTNNIMINNSFGRLGIDSSASARNLDFRLGFSGAIVRFMKKTYFSRPISSSFTVVDVPNIRNVSVLRDNHIIGKTDEDGKIIITNVPSYQKTEYSIDPFSLPLDVYIKDELTKIDNSPYKAGSYVKFDAKESKTAIINVFIDNNTPVPVGSSAYIKNSEEEENKLFAVGQNGEIFLEDLNTKNFLIVEWVGGKCQLWFNYIKDSKTPVALLGKHFCQK